MKQYIGISRDHSGSMSSLRNAAMNDYNNVIKSIKQATIERDVDTIVSVVRCGVKGGVDQESVNSSVAMLKPLTTYVADGGTPLFDSVGSLIELLKTVPDGSDPNVSFLIMAVTDGEENQSRNWSGARLAAAIRTLQATDRWTFVFRVPRGYGRQLEKLGIPSGNIHEWEQTERGMRESSIQTQAAVTSYYTNVSRGIKSTDHFYANAASVSQSAVKQVAQHITRDSKVLKVPARAGRIEIKLFVEGEMGYYHPGTVFYELMKTEKSVSSSKLLVVRNRKTGKIYGGSAVRSLLGLPTQGAIKLSPGMHGEWDIFVQSTSNNRILVPGTSVIYWPGAN